MTAQPKPTKRRWDRCTATPVGTLLNELGISLPRLVELLSKATPPFPTSGPMLSRFVNEKLRADYMSRFAAAIAPVLARVMIDQGFTRSETDARLSLLFTEGEYKPMISRRIALTDQECEFFGFIADVEGKMTAVDPFKEPPQTREEVYFPAEYRAIYDRVLDAIKYRHFVAVLGPIGSGKTTLRAMVEDQVARDSNLKVIWPEFFDQAKISAYEIARSILRECDAKVPGRAAALGTAVTRKLQSLTQNGKRVALAFDECHKMHKTTIRSLKNFHEMSSGGFQKYLGIVLFGWLEFESMLMDPEFQEIYERLDVITMPAFAGGLAKKGTKDTDGMAIGYLRHRFKLIGLKAEDYFDDEALDYIGANADTPLQLGNLANQALRISMTDFDNRQVVGAAIRTKIHFDTARQPQGFRKR